ncbi:hypothetical protein [Streptomyces rhizosphaerihabitans]|uniref:hypothetical protein n=1 Tax=Streptomyces rhizosphaerihabitans TaxID=1266770 RepID=UPI0021C0C67A|nr:hypothetical protein [Streptomyces rhizosphaerihabitans]MCT9010346.1 hypothetical protein [Streptomyces rhizosphaerihabitans]
MAASTRIGEDTTVIPLNGRLPGTPESTRRHLDWTAALWPVLRVPRGAARTAAYGLAWLLLEAAVTEAFDLFYWSDSNAPRHTTGLLVPILLTVPALLMTAALASAVRLDTSDRRWHMLGRALSTLAWTAAVTASLMALVTLVIGAADLCEMTAPPVPAHLEPALMVPACLVAALALGAAVGSAASALSRHRMGTMARYAVWIATAAVSVFLLLAPILRASPTCRPVVP